jgi:hypothetical protein
MILIKSLEGSPNWINPRYIVSVYDHDHKARPCDPDTCECVTELQVLHGDRIKTLGSVTPVDTIIDRINR